VNAGDVATPLELVVAVAVVTPPANVPSVDAGDVKVTVTPLVGVPPVVAVAVRGFVNGAPTAVPCPPPLVAVIVTVGGGVVVFELELLQLVKKIKVEKIKVEIVKAGTLQ
jgi:hypothetical protein